MKHPELYEIQKQFIKDAKQTIEKSHIGIFSSPTGTGKTLSLLLSISEYITEQDDQLPFYDDFEVNNRIYFCSRTHSQLNQCINEFKKLETKTNSVILGSRKIYCINEEIDNKDNIEKVNQKCLDLIKDEKCKYYKNDIFLTGIVDIEELVKEGQRHEACPYYFTKKYLKKSEIIFLPYNILFNEETRNSLNINLKGSIVIVDEAHNIIESVNNINTKCIPFEVLFSYKTALDKYIKKNIKNIKSKDKLLIINEILNNFLKSKSRNPILMSVNDFIYKFEILNYNMLEIVEFMRKNNICNKIEAYTSQKNKIYDIMKFMCLLVNSDEFCKIEITSKYLKIFPVKSEVYFEPFFDCKSIIFAGGTMEPIDELRNIFKKREVDYYAYKSLNKNFKGFIISKLDKESIRITEKTRDSEFIRRCICRILREAYGSINKGGIVVFVPSKHYVDIFRKIIYSEDIRNIYFEDEFEEYKNSVSYQTNLLIAVMGGRLSEGINFSDDLCRILLVFGVPFSNMTNEIKEKISLYGTEYYLHNAMKKVNQTIGRSIRHKDDYACIFLVDERFIQYRNEISSWIREDLTIKSLSLAMTEMKEFIGKFT